MPLDLDGAPIETGTVVYDVDGVPRVTLTKTSSSYTAIVEVTGLAPVRGTNADERFVGITSLDPPTVTVKRQRDPAKSMRALIDASIRAVQASSTSTTGDSGGPGALLMVGLKVAMGVRGALRQLQEDI